MCGSVVFVVTQTHVHSQPVKVLIAASSSRCDGHGGSGPHFAVTEMDLMMLDVIEPKSGIRLQKIM
jgi:hypothetical protein